MQFVICVQRGQCRLVHQGCLPRRVGMFPRGHIHHIFPQWRKGQPSINSSPAVWRSLPQRSFCSGQTKFSRLLPPLTCWKKLSREVLKSQHPFRLHKLLFETAYCDWNPARGPSTSLVSRGWTGREYEHRRADQVPEAGFLPGTPRLVCRAPLALLGIDDSATGHQAEETVYRHR